MTVEAGLTETQYLEAFQWAKTSPLKSELGKAREVAEGRSVH